MAGSASNMFQKNNILILEDSEHSFLVLGKDLMGSIRGSSPDEGVAECDYSDEQSVYSSASQCHCNADNKLHKMLEGQGKLKVENDITMKAHEYERKITSFQEEMASTLRETSENLDLLRSAGGSIDEINRVMGYMEDSVHSTIASTRSRTSSWGSDVTLVPFQSAEIGITESAPVLSSSVESLALAAEIQDAMGDETEEHSMETNKTQSGFFADSGKLQDHLQKTNTSDIDPRDWEIMNLKLTNEILKEQIQRLQNNNFVESLSQIDRSLEPFLPNANLTKYQDAYKEALQKLKNSFASTYFRYTEQQNIILDCVDVINGIESMKFKEDGSLIESDLAEYKKKLTDCGKKLTREQILIMEDKQGIVNAERQFHNILSAHSFLLRELASATLANKTLNEEIDGLLLEKVEENVDHLDTLKQEQEMDALADEGKNSKGEEQSHNVEKSVLDKETSMLKLEDIKDESDALLKEKNIWLEERASLINAIKIVEDELMSREAKREAEREVLEQKCTLLKTRSDTIQVDLDNLKAELAGAHTIISELREQNADLHDKTENGVYIYINHIKKLEMDISRLRATEKSYLDQIHSLTDKNTSLKTKFDTIQVDLDNLKAKLASAADVCKARCGKQEIDILRLRATERSYLSQIESLTDENKILRGYINNTFLKKKQ